MVWRLVFVWSVAGLAILNGERSSSAQSVTEEVRNSRWDTRYENGGSTVRAIVTFSGTRGTYDVLNSSGSLVGTGRLSGVRYFDAGGKVLITGNWSFRGEDGFFQLEVSDDAPKAIRGAWNNSSVTRGGTWSGTRLADGGDGGGGGGANVGGVTYGSWQRTAKGNFTRSCTLPGGARQYLVIFEEKPEWVYWYNPATQKYWCACPTTGHPDFGDRIAAGQDLFLMAMQKSARIDDTVFPDDSSANFRSGVTAKDRDGSDVPLGCPPTDLPPGI